MLDRTQNDVMKNWPKDWNKPVVSVQCITYNQELYIANALDSFLMQETNFPFEVIVHDDASTDETADVIKAYEEKYPKIIKPIYETENQFSKRDGSLRKIVNNACNGKYFAYCEGDDFWCDPLKLQKQYDIMESHPECSLCTHIVQVISEKGIKRDAQIPSNEWFDKNIVEQHEFAQTLIAEHRFPFQTSCYFIPKKIIQENISFFDSPGNGDEKTLRVCLNEGKIYFIKSVMSCYRSLSAGSWTVKTLKSNGVEKGWLNTINLNNLFDVFSKHKFHNYIKNGNEKIQLDILIQKRLFKKLFEAENYQLAQKFYTSKQLKKYYVLSKVPSFAIGLLYKVYPYFIKVKKHICKHHRNGDA